HGQAGEHLPVLRHVPHAPADDLVGELAGHLLPGQPDRAGRGHQRQQGAQRGGLAGTVAPQQGGHTTLAYLERDAVQDVRLAEDHVEPVDLQDHRCSPRYAACTVASAITRCGVSHANSAPWCMTAIRSASPTATSIRCSTSTMEVPRVSRTLRIARVSSGTSSAPMPAVGSSSSSTFGRPTTASATSSLRLPPWDSDAAGTWAC